MNSCNRSSGMYLMLKDLNLKPGPIFTVNDIVVGIRASELLDQGMNKMEALCTMMREGTLPLPEGCKFVDWKKDEV